MLYWSLIFLFVALLGLGVIAFSAAGARKILPGPDPHTRWDSATYIPACFRRMRVRALAAARRIRSIRIAKRRWQRGVLNLVICTTPIVGAFVLIGFYHVYFDRSDLPDIEAFARFEFPTIGTVYDANGQPLIELAKEYRKITKYEEIPPIVRDAIISTEDKHFFSHSGVDYSVVPRLLGKVRIRALAARLIGLGPQDGEESPALLPQGGSTITQQLVRGYFLKNLTTKENNNHLLYAGIFPRSLSTMVGARTVNMLVRKLEEIRLSLWIEKEMQKRFGSKRNAKEEILARYASFIYMGNNQYGFATAAEYYFGRPLATFTTDDADKAALLAGIAKSPRYYAPSAKETKRVLRRRNQTLALMAANGFISRDSVNSAEQRPIRVIARRKDKMLQAPAVLGTILQELKVRGADLTVENLFQGRIQVYSTVDARVQKIVDEALERGLDLYEQRHPSAKGIIQGSVVVLRNRDASIIAETGGRQFYQDRATAYSDFNRVTKSLRQPGSTMKPIVYLAAFRQGGFNLETVVPDEPIGVSDGEKQSTKWISNYDEQFRGMIPVREALAESRNAAAIWLTEQIGIGSVLRTSQILGVKTRLQPYATTALGASEVNLLELANAYRAMASGIFAEPYVIRKIVRDSVEVAPDNEMERSVVDVDDSALALIQEGLRGVVRIPTGTAHALDSGVFPIAVLGKTGTTNEFRDALFVGSTYGAEGITVAVRIGFDDNRSLGAKETGGRVALPVFKELMLRVYREKLVGPVPTFPAQMEQNINDYLAGGSMAKGEILTGLNPSNPPASLSVRFTDGGDASQRRP
jgi:membrane peptidoglycan carboxypeptidase